MSHQQLCHTGIGPRFTTVLITAKTLLRFGCSECNKAKVSPQRLKQQGIDLVTITNTLSI